MSLLNYLNNLHTRKSANNQFNIKILQKINLQFFPRQFKAAKFYQTLVLSNIEKQQTNLSAQQMLGSICIILCIIYLFGSYFDFNHYLLVFSAIINLIVLSIWSGKLSFNQTMKKFFSGEIFWSFLWILWIYFNPNVFICRKYMSVVGRNVNSTLLQYTESNNIHYSNSKLQENHQTIYAGISKMLQQEASHIFNQPNQAIESNLHLSQIAPIGISALILLPLLFHIPLMISNLGKLYMLFSNPQKVDNSLLEELIIFQSKLELGIFFYCLLEIVLNVFNPDISMVVTLVALGIILKAKYNFHYGTQKAYKQLHFAFDRLCKGSGCRSLYHGLYKTMSLGYLNLISQKSVAY